MTRSRDVILQELTREDARLVGLERARDEARARIELLRSELATASTTAPIPPPSPPAGNSKPLHTAADKVKLFRSLFRGRMDIFPIRFVSKKTGKPGYAPACSNKWEPGLCLLKTGGKCIDCLNQAFFPVGDQVVIDHLQGRHVMGAYPLLEDETCWFLAVDFDKHSWMEDTAAFAETCRSIGVPVAVERSRSGNGAHAWFFFAAPVSANVARRMGCYLVTETMNRRHELSMESYDRLFPNQDTMPRGGFGNLIALPLQHEPRQQGNSVFVDARFEPFADQWAFLTSVQRVDPATAEAIARDATRTGQIVGVRFAEAIDDEDAAAPWKRLPSGPHSDEEDHRPVAVQGKGRARTTALHREDRIARSIAESVEATRGVPKTRILQKAAHAPIHRDDSPGDRLRPRARAAHLTTKRLCTRSGTAS